MPQLSSANGQRVATVIKNVTVLRGRVSATATPTNGTSARYVAHVTPTSPSFEMPGGSVIFLRANGVAICSQNLAGNQATCTGPAVSGAVRVTYRPGRDYAPLTLQPVSIRS